MHDFTKKKPKTDMIYPPDFGDTKITFTRGLLTFTTSIGDYHFS